MQEDNSGNLWLGTNQGLAKLTISGKEKGRVRIFTVADGLADNFFNQMLLSIVMVPSILDAAGEL